MSFTRTANGNIVMSRFVKLDTTADGKVLQAGSGDQPFGVSQPGTRYTPYAALDDGNAAIAGENLLIYGRAGQRCLLELGGTVTRGDLLKPDSSGRGVTSSSDGDYYGARALVSGVLGGVVEVELHFGFRGA